jgi:hypothetical protein
VETVGRLRSSRQGVPHASHFASPIAERLAALDRPVTESGMRLVHEIVTDGGSPLYDRAAEGEIVPVPAGVLAGLEPR